LAELIILKYVSKRLKLYVETDELGTGTPKKIPPLAGPENPVHGPAPLSRDLTAPAEWRRRYRLIRRRTAEG
jgi:hypothetical protein